MGQDAGGVTRDLLATYWHHMLQQWFHGERVKVPCVPASKVADAETVFLAAGRVWMHGLLLTRSMPCEISMAFLLSACQPYTAASEDLLIAELLTFVSKSEAAALEKGLSTTGKET